MKKIFNISIVTFSVLTLVFVFNKKTPQQEAVNTAENYSAQEVQLIKDLFK